MATIDMTHLERNENHRDPTNTRHRSSMLYETRLVSEQRARLIIELNHSRSEKFLERPTAVPKRPLSTQTST
ncbi:hypothetical protein KC319_g24 [Hortaea werneckii]|nr:hypothetical protein KC319_g24 [Hortaea werneckii]